VTPGVPEPPSQQRRDVAGGWRAGVASASTATLARPQAWPLALAGFLARGGILLFILPIVVVPTPTGLATFFGPLIVTIVTTGPDAGIFALAALASMAALVALVVGGLLGAAVDVVLIGWFGPDVSDRAALAARRPLPEPPADIRALTRRTFGVRLAAHLPLVVVAPWTVARIVDATYHELILPSDVAIPLVLLVVRAALVPVLVLVVAWFLGETIGGLAAREVVLARRSIPAALGRGSFALVRHPLTSAATAVLGFAGLVLLVAPALAAAIFAWHTARGVLLGDGQVLAALLAATLLAATWIGALTLAAVAATWRSALWTAFAVRVAIPGPIPAPNHAGTTAPLQGR
jgi:hypothetical protein